VLLDQVERQIPGGLGAAGAEPLGSPYRIAGYNRIMRAPKIAMVRGPATAGGVRRGILLLDHRFHCSISPRAIDHPLGFEANLRANS
jgi:hypothetical protein